MNRQSMLKHRVDIVRLCLLLFVLLLVSSRLLFSASDVVSKSSSSEQEYILGPDDEIEIDVWQHEDLHRKVKISPGGYISYPFVGYIKVSGMTVKQLAEVLEKKLSEYIIKPEVTVIVTKYRSHKAFFLGRVNRPGFVSLFGNERLLSALLKAGGFANDADITQIRVVHKDGSKTLVNLQKAVFGEDLSQNIVLKNGDVVYIPARESAPPLNNRVFLFGAVGKPGLYDYFEGMTILDLISKAGNPTYAAVMNSTKIVRQTDEGPTIINVRLKDLVKKGEFKENYQLKPGDIVYVPTKLITNINRFMSELMPIVQTINTVYTTKALLTR